MERSEQPQEQERALARPPAPPGTAPEASGAGRPADATGASDGTDARGGTGATDATGAMAGRIALLAPPAGARTRALIARALRSRWAPRIALCLLIAFSVAGKAVDISQPCEACGGSAAKYALTEACSASHMKYTLIFDEKYYVNAARVMDGIEPPAGCPYRGDPKGDDPNAEHPQLAKLAIAAGIDVFGDNPLGWRIGSILFAAVALLALYALVTGAGGSSWLATGTVAVAALDNLMLVHGRIATLDIYAMAMMLVAGALYVRERPLLAGLALGVAACMKEVALFLVFVFVLLEATRVARAWISGRRASVATTAAAGAGTGSSAVGGVRDGAAAGHVREEIHYAAWRPGGGARTIAWQRLSRLILFLVSGAVATLGLLWLLDALVPAYDPGTHIVYSGNPFAHLSHMYDYAQLLKSKPNETGIASSPLSWLLDERAINYARVAVNTLVNGKVVGSHATISFQGLMNPFIVFLAIPALLAAIAAALRSDDGVAAVGACWCLGTYLPFLIGDAASGRVSYLYYMLIAMPGVYIVTTRLFAPRRLPVAAAVGWAIALVYGFVHLYPIRTLL